MLPVKLFILIENDFPRSLSQQKTVFREVMGKHKVSQERGVCVCVFQGIIVRGGLILILLIKAPMLFDNGFFFTISRTCPNLL